MISAERLGPGQDGLIHAATALPLQGRDAFVRFAVVDIPPVVTEARKRGILTIGIGDHGNGFGFGAIRDAVVRAVPKGETLCPTVATDIVLPAMMSNRGCSGIEAALAWLLKRPDPLHSPAQADRILRACLDAGGLGAMWRASDFIVDSADGESSMAVVQLLNNLVRLALQPPTRGVAH